MSVEFITKDYLQKLIDDNAISALSKKTKRHGNSISLRAIIYNCIRATYFEIMGYDPVEIEADKISIIPGFCFMGPVGDAIHSKLQSLLGLDKFEYTEKYMSFNDEQVSPLITIKTKCDGLTYSSKSNSDDNIIMYEIKTKDKIPDEPYKDELSQCICGAWLFARNLKIPIKGATMIYFNRNLVDFNLFHYNFIDKNDTNYFNTDDMIMEFINKLRILNSCVKENIPPSITNEYVKKIAFGKSNCDSCVYRKVCSEEIENVIL